MNVWDGALDLLALMAFPAQNRASRISDIIGTRHAGRRGWTPWPEPMGPITF